MSKEIQISSVMLCFNRVALSQKCFESYLNTISVPHELIIIDNASTDGTREWLEEVIKDTRVGKVIRMEKNDPAAALNQGLTACTGKYLHVMENDYIYLDGWDKYVLRCFHEIANLGQLSICSAAREHMGGHHRNLVYLSERNVVSSSVFPRAIFFHHRICWQNIYKSSRPDDREFSRLIKEAGFLVAWPDHPVAESVGFSPDELRRDPRYYLRDLREKLNASPQARSMLRDVQRPGTDPDTKK